MRGLVTVGALLLLPLLLAGAAAAPLPSPSPQPSASPLPSPVDRLLDHHAEQGSSWQAWLLLDSEDDDSAALEHSQRQGGSAPRRITPKSVFIAPAFTPDQLPACAEGYRADSMGRCVKVLRVDQAAHLDFLLRRLNAAYAPPKQSAVTAAAQGRPPGPVPQGPLKLPLPVETPTTSSTTTPAPKPTSQPSPALKPVSETPPAVKPVSETPPPKADQSVSEDTGTADMIISLFGAQEGSGGGAGDEDSASVDPTVLSAGPPAEDVDVRDTLPMLVLTHTDSSSTDEDEVDPEPQRDTSEAVNTSPIRGESNSLPSISSTSQAPQVTLIADKHEHSVGGQMMQDASSVPASDASPSDNQAPVSSSQDSKSPGSSKKRTGVPASDDWRERPIPSDDTVKTVPVGTRNVDTPSVGSVPVSNVKVATTHTAPLETSPVHNSSKKNSVRDPVQTQKQHGSQSSTFATANVPDAHGGSISYNHYNSPEVNHPQEWSGVTNRIPHTDNGYVRFPQGHGGSYVRFPLDAFQEQRNSGGSKLWWLQPGPDGWRVRHPDPRYRPALVRFFTRLPPFHGHNAWDTYNRRA